MLINNFDGKEYDFWDEKPTTTPPPKNPLTDSELENEAAGWQQWMFGLKKELVFCKGDPNVEENKDPIAIYKKQEGADLECVYKIKLTPQILLVLFHQQKPVVVPELKEITEELIKINSILKEDKKK
jgi:hypothetical protein